MRKKSESISHSTVSGSCSCMDCSLFASVHGLQARMLEWFMFLPSPGDLPDPWIGPASCLAESLLSEPTRKPNPDIAKFISVIKIILNIFKKIMLIKWNKGLAIKKDEIYIMAKTKWKLWWLYCYIKRIESLKAWEDKLFYVRKDKSSLEHRVWNILKISRGNIWINWLKFINQTLILHLLQF